MGILPVDHVLFVSNVIYHIIFYYINVTLLKEKKEKGHILCYTNILCCCDSAH
jgi:hypothetical protein